MTYDKEAWKNSLAKLRGLAGKISPDNGNLAVWGEKLESDAGIAALSDEQIIEKLRCFQDFGVKNERGEKVFFPPSYGFFREFLLTGNSQKTAETNGSQQISLPEAWQRVVANGTGVGKPGCSCRAGLAASTAMLLRDGVVEISVPCAATLANLANCAMLPLVLGRAEFAGQNTPAPFPNCHFSGVKLRYSGVSVEAHLAEREWPAWPSDGAKHGANNIPATSFGEAA